MNRTHTITTTTIDRWLLPHIAGILAYAQTDHVFAITLATWLDEERWMITPTQETTTSAHLTPSSRAQADDITDWLMHELSTHPEARVARSTLMHWAGSYVIPTDLLAQLSNETLSAIRKPATGPTTRPGTTLQLVMNTQWQETLPYDRLTSATHALTQQLLGAELRKASGKIDSLHPDSAEWCMAANGTTVHCVDESVLHELALAASAESLHHAILTDEHGMNMIAVSPHVQDTFVAQYVPSAV